ncbi:HEPN domain-containing protein [Methanoculleus sp.]|uniref:HEPN domain-containing protein n=1 Tax=Methanoculleus sp. TaxID=90427 RepID=UPI001BD1F6CB|nr:HEPN domain-containing protein [Methanoculleus sp.]
MDQLIWCGRIRSGIALTAPNETLASAYLKKAEEALETMQTITARDWKITTAYYAMYFSLYAVLTRIGIRCENHSCTILLMERLLSDYFTPAETTLVERARGARVDAQYYVSREVPDPFCEELIRAAPRFLVKCAGIVGAMNEKTIGILRERLAEAMREE